MKGILALMLILCATPCFAEEITLYNENGLSLSYSYEKIGTIKDPDCPDLLFDEYQASAKVQNSSNQAVTFDDTGWLVPRVAFVAYTCTKLGKLTSQQSNYFGDLFLPHRVYGTGTPNTGFAAVHPYFLDPNDKYTSAFTTIRVPSGEPLAKPDWYFPEWKFINIPNQNVATTEKTISQPTNTKDSYEKLIVGKWRVAQTSRLLNGKEIEVYDEEDACFVIYEANKRVTLNIGDCNNGQEIGNWSISGNILTEHTTNFNTQDEILLLNKSMMKVKSTRTANLDGSYNMAILERVTN